MRKNRIHTLECSILGIVLICTGVDTHSVVPREGFEPTLRFRKRILSPPRLPFRHLGMWEVLEAASVFEPLHRGFSDPRLNHLATPPHVRIRWCRGGDLNSYGLLAHHPLKMACLPDSTTSAWQGRQDSNPRHAVLETAALPD